MKHGSRKFTVECENAKCNTYATLEIKPREGVIPSLRHAQEIIERGSGAIVPTGQILDYTWHKPRSQCYSGPTHNFTKAK